ncbi:carboxypeptidase-like regulatory domain-containing protein [Bacteroidota bacterium]
MNVQEAEIEEVLNLCLEKTDLTYIIQNNVIIITPKLNQNNSEKPKGLTQTIRGIIIDKDSKVTLPGANIIVLNSSPLIGGVSDNDGDFRLENVPIGRHNIKVSYIGYEELLLPEIMVGSAKEVILTLQLTESITDIREVVVRPYAKGAPKNEMAMISARSFSVEDASRFAASVGDPARMALVYAGVNGDDDITNQIVIRGNSPSGMLWRVEGAQIPNPNHFYAEGMDYGGISILSVNMLGNSDFLTGAFPAEYGNATSGVFDISLRNGNNKKREHTVQAGLLGIDLSMEGPFSKNYNGSYLFNYRYSSTYLLNLMGLKLFGDMFPSWSDFSFKLNLPTKKVGTFSIWGLGGKSNMESEPLADSSVWEKEYDREGYSTNPAMGATGVTHIYFPDNKSYFKSVISFSGNMHNDDYYRLDSNYVQESYYKESLHSSAFRVSTLYNRKFSSRISLRTGFIYSNLGYNVDFGSLDDETDRWVKDNAENGSTDTYQAYLQTKEK